MVAMYGDGALAEEFGIGLWRHHEGRLRRVGMLINNPKILLLSEN